MQTFTTTMFRIVERCPLTLLAIACDADEQVNLEPEEEIEFEVEVEYKPGWFQPGRYSGPPEDCYPDEGEDPEIIRVTVIGEEDTVDIVDSLSWEEWRDLVAEADSDQSQREADAKAEEADYRYEMAREREWDRDYDY